MHFVDENTARMESFADYIAYIKTLFEEKNLKRWFRGQTEERFRLTPSGMRNNYTPQDERYFTHDFYRKVMTIRKDCPKKNEYSAWLTLMRHYWLPTRLLDWSRSPLIACYFATLDYDKNNEDCCIWVLCPSELNKHYGFGEYLYPMNKAKVKKLLLSAFEVDEGNVELQPTNKIIACWATEYDMRVYAQQSAFTVHDCRTPLDMVQGNDNWLKKIIIPNELKSEFAKTLKMLGFESSDIFPDMEHVAKDLRGTI